MNKHSTTIPRQTSPVPRAAERTEHERHCGCWPCLRIASPYLALLDETEDRAAAVQAGLRTDVTAAGR